MDIIKSNTALKIAISKKFPVKGYSIYLCNTQYKLYELIITSIVLSFSTIIKTPHIICSNIEHPYIIEILERYSERRIITVSYISANIHGAITQTETMKCISEYNLRPSLLIVSYINYLTGTTNDIKSICAMAHRKNIPLFSDCIYSYGRVHIGYKDDIDIHTAHVSQAVYILAIKNELFEGYKLNTYNLEFRDNDKLFNISDIDHKNVHKNLLTLNLTIKDIAAKSSAIIKLNKYFMTALKKLCKKMSSAIHDYEFIVTNNIVPRKNDIVMLSSGIPHIVSFIYMGPTKIPPIEVNHRLFEHIGIKKKYLNNIITIFLDKYTVKDINHIIGLIKPSKTSDL